ncbi:MAG: nickel-dependent lactate racemase [Myxococcota bacterium]
MAKARVGLMFAGEKTEFELPEGWEVISELKPNWRDGLKDIPRALVESFDNPIGCEPLGAMKLSGKRILLAVDDISRPTPLCLFFGELVKYLCEKGAKREDMMIITALGVHRPMSEEELFQKLGKGNFEGVKWENHDSRNAEMNIELGMTARGTHISLNRRLKEADLIICVGAIEPHLLLGFGGGSKMILPGLASERTIAENHMQGVSAEMFNYIGFAESPMRLDLEEAAGMLNQRIFIVNVVLNEKLEICRFVCGDPVKAHREGVKLVDAINGRDISELADVAIVASNPMNADLRQGMKCIGNIEKSVKDNGLILALVECKNGIGDVNVPKKALSNGLLRFILRLIGAKRVLWFIDKVKKDAGTEERFLAHFSMQVVRKNRIFVYSKNLPAGTDKKLGLFRQFGTIEEMMSAAKKNAPKNARVYIFPFGGVTYPRKRE